MPDGSVTQIDFAYIPDSELEEALDGIVDYFRRYAVFPDEHCYTVAALWAAHTWVVDSFYATPRLIFDSAEPGSGKTRVLELLKYLAYKPELMSNSTGAALVHMVNDEGTPPTVLVDETDVLFARGTGENAGVLSMLNSGYKKGATTPRVAPKTGDGESGIIRYKSFAAVALAGLTGNVPEPLMTRGISIHMRKRRSDEHIHPWRERHAASQTRHIRSLLESWAERSARSIAQYVPEPVDGVLDRSEEIWEPLLAVGEYAGDRWALLARSACHFFVVEQKANQALSVGVQLLYDLKEIYGDKTRMPTSHIIEELSAMEDGPWAEFNRTAPISPRQLSKLLSKYEVRVQSFRIKNSVFQGYRVDGEGGLGDAWDRYAASPTTRRL